MKANHMRYYSFLISSFLILVGLFIAVPTGQAKVIYGSEIVDAPPPVEKKKKKQRKKRIKKRHKNWRKAPQQEQDIVPSLYMTFTVMGLLPLLVMGGIIWSAIGFPFLLHILFGLGFVLLGNVAAIIAGRVAGATKTYSTQILSFALWFFFGINLAGAIVFLSLFLTIFTGFYLMLGMAIGMALFAIGFLIWALIVHHQNKDLRNSNTEEDAE